MKVGIFSHCTMDTIIYENEQYDAPGGPASYCSITAKKPDSYTHLTLPTTPYV